MSEIEIARDIRKLEKQVADLWRLANSEPRIVEYLHSTTVTTTSHTAVPSDQVIYCDCATAGGAITVNLPAASTVKYKTYDILKIDGGGAGITIDPDGAELINGAATYAIAGVPFRGIRIHCNGSVWYVLSTI